MCVCNKKDALKLYKLDLLEMGIVLFDAAKACDLVILLADDGVSILVC